MSPAAATAGSGAETAAGQGRATCTPCRGTGRVLSALGGNSHQVTCPWCGGSGKFTAGRDAQEEPAEHASGNAAASGS